MAPSRRVKIAKAAKVKPFGQGAGHSQYGLQPQQMPMPIGAAPGLSPMNISTQQGYVGRQMPNSGDFARRLGQALAGVNQ